MPLARRLPKFGFTNPFRVEYTVVNVASLAKRFPAGSSVDPEALVNAGMVRSKMPVKVLATGEISHALTVKAHAFSDSARQKIEAAGGTVEVIPPKAVAPVVRKKGQKSAPEKSEAPAAPAVEKPESESSTDSES
jgi:large subunit ribosomal protein L15